MTEQQKDDLHKVFMFYISNKGMLPSSLGFLVDEIEPE